MCAGPTRCTPVGRVAPGEARPSEVIEGPAVLDEPQRGRGGRDTLRLDTAHANNVAHGATNQRTETGRADQNPSDVWLTALGAGCQDLLAAPLTGAGSQVFWG